MKIHRTIINPQTEADLVVHLPERFLQKETEVIAFSIDDYQAPEGKRTYEEMVRFYRDNAIDFTKIEKWKREDLYE
ncbi:MAG: hypothetical protein K2U26_03245 [Cyclobacteriaceae bacterium]|nr:hypothetical protein [Cyclobacteriaceae bacterium]